MKSRGRRHTATHLSYLLPFATAITLLMSCGDGDGSNPGAGGTGTAGAGGSAGSATGGALSQGAQPYRSCSSSGDCKRKGKIPVCANTSNVFCNTENTGECAYQLANAQGCDCVEGTIRPCESDGLNGIARCDAVSDAGTVWGPCYPL